MATRTPFGVSLQAAREKAGLTAAELAVKANVSPTTIWRLESGETQKPHRSLKRALIALLPQLAAFGNPEQAA